MAESSDTHEYGPGVPPVPFASPLIAHALEQSQIGKYHTKGGHGFVAEDVNHFADRIRGKQAVVAGITNELNGADRIINGVQVQSKYCRTASETVAAAFDSNGGMYRYSGQLLEVPKDQYESCLEIMRGRIQDGRIPGLTDPAEAEAIVKQGTITYKQARNIARSGNIDSIVFDAQTQAVTSSYVFAISFAVSFAQGLWRGDSKKEAAQAALATAVASGATTFVTGLMSAQILRSRAAALGVVTMRRGVKAIAESPLGKNAICRIATGSLGKAVYSAAAVNHVAKLVRSNAVTATVAAVTTATPDFYRAAFDRSISWRQFGKNLVVNSVGIAGGTAGWLAGAALGAAAGSVIPVLGTAAGGVIGGLAGALSGGAGSSIAAKAVADKLAEDDSVHLIEVLRGEIECLGCDYMLTEQEVAEVSETVKTTVTPKWLRKMYQSGKSKEPLEAQQDFVRREFEPKIQAISEKRPRVALPSADVLDAEMSVLIEQLDFIDVDSAINADVVETQLESCE